MGERGKGVKLLPHIMFIWLLSWHAEISFADSIIQHSSDTSITSDSGGTYLSDDETGKVLVDLEEVTNGNTSSEAFHTLLTNSTPSSHNIIGEPQNSTAGNGQDMSLTSQNSDSTNMTSGLSANSTTSVDFLSENLGNSKWTVPENKTEVLCSYFCLLVNKIWKPSKSENISTGHITHDISIWEEYEQKDAEQKKYFGAHRLLALFLGMAGGLVCLLVLVYCIYSRQHKEDMFSHHRLYGEGFEDPVLHLDTPVDHFDFFSFRDTEMMTPAPTPQHKAKNNFEPKLDFAMEEPKGTSSNEYLQQIIQMGSLKLK